MLTRSRWHRVASVMRTHLLARRGPSDPCGRGAVGRVRARRSSTNWLRTPCRSSPSPRRGRRRIPRNVGGRITAWRRRPKCGRLGRLHRWAGYAWCGWTGTRYVLPTGLKNRSRGASSESHGSRRGDHGSSQWVHGLWYVRSGRHCLRHKIRGGLEGGRAARHGKRRRRWRDCRGRRHGSRWNRRRGRNRCRGSCRCWRCRCAEWRRNPSWGRWGNTNHRSFHHGLVTRRGRSWRGRDRRRRSHGRWLNDGRSRRGCRTRRPGSGWRCVHHQHGPLELGCGGSLQVESTFLAGGCAIVILRATVRAKHSRVPPVAPA